MKIPARLARVWAALVSKADEGQYRAGPYQLPITGGWLSAHAGSFLNWWQLGFDPWGRGGGAVVEACISAYSQTVATCPGDHWRRKENGGRERVTNSALSRILRHPNDYQSMSDFMLNLTRSLYLDGNAYALALRNDRYEIDELHLMDPRMSWPQLAVTGDVFYTLKGNDIIDYRIDEPLIVPARDVLHVRLHCIERRRPFPLKGETPLTAALADIEAGQAITQQQIQFYMNQARPSAVLSTELRLEKNEVDRLRELWEEQVKGLHTGGTPILTSGLKVQPWSTPSKDASTADVLKLTNEHIALAFRIPLQILGLGGTTYSSTEVLYQSWISSGLGFALNHIEEAFGLLFSLRGQPDEYVEFDTTALLRSARKDRMDSLARGVLGGIYSPNEARELEGLPAVEAGGEPRLQAQVVPLSAAGKIPPMPSARPSAPAIGLPSLPRYHSDDIRRCLLNAADKFDRGAA